MLLTHVRKKAIEAIRSEVKRRGLSIRMVVDITDLSYSQIQKILSDNHASASLDSILSLCEALKISFDLIIYPKFT
ncbi:Cro/C1-type HTH DNA-binding domain protein [Leptospira ellinghausenii]|uniref:Cro/C1-type HTH DNA-binding domain protein n=1 Tax=Leptospira ellinghausenii TaxID=1917822 RepID=A0A2P2DIS9_9LEPT|nr:Cro/C1-type HTH DNA-binding domain protein [Leptospira ellinghausenii]